MQWWEHRIRIRRMLRDPGHNIWNDRLLAHLWNDSAAELVNRTGMLADAASIRIPPSVHMVYTYDWEYGHAQPDQGHVRKWGYEHQQDGRTCSHIWETTASWGMTAATHTDLGESYMQPWEAWYCGTAQDPPASWLPSDFHEAVFVCWDKKLIDYMTRKEVEGDASWRTRSGEPFAYYRRDDVSHEFCLYPWPSSPTWDDRTGEGMILFDDGGDTYDSNYGTIANWPGRVSNQDNGIGVDMVDENGNVFMVYRARATEFTGAEQEESNIPSFLAKYVEFGVLERAYGSNTDGKIESLRDYWAMRRKLGIEVIRRVKIARLADRDYRMKTGTGKGMRNRRQPRLPDAYPAVW